MERCDINHSPIRIGVIGIGKHCQEYILPALNQHPLCKLSVFCSKHKNEKLLQDYFVNYWTDDWRELVHSDMVDVVVVVADPELHSEVVRLSHSLGKPVFVEKPISLNYDKWTNLAHSLIGSKKKSPIFVGYNYRMASGYSIFLNSNNPKLSKEITWEYRSSKPTKPFWDDHTVLESMVFGVGIHAVAMLDDIFCTIPTLINAEIEKDDKSEKFQITYSLLYGEKECKLVLGNNSDKLVMTYSITDNQGLTKTLHGFDFITQNGGSDMTLTLPSVTSLDRNGYDTEINRFVQLAANPSSWQKKDFIQEQERIMSTCDLLVKSGSRLQ